MQTRISAKVFTRLAALAFAGQLLYAVLHLAMDGRYPGYEHRPHDPAHDAVMALAWLGGLVAMLAPRPWLFYVAAAGTLASFAHFLLVSISLPWVGLPFLLATGLEIVCLSRSGPLFRGASSGASDPRAERISRELPAR